MRSWRSVTMTPMGIPVRSLKAAIDFLARVITAFWPVIACRSPTAASSVFGFWMASPMPMLMTTFSRRGTCMTLTRFRSFIRAGTTSVVNRSRKRACATVKPPNHGAAWPPFNSSDRRSRLSGPAAWPGRAAVNAAIGSSAGRDPDRGFRRSACRRGPCCRRAGRRDPRGWPGCTSGTRP